MRRFSPGRPFEAPPGCSRAAGEGPWRPLPGAAAHDRGAMRLPESAAVKARNAMATIPATLDAAGRLTDALAAGLAAAMKDALPAATAIVAGPIRPEMKIEIEVTAFRE